MLQLFAHYSCTCNQQGGNLMTWHAGPLSSHIFQCNWNIYTTDRNIQKPMIACASLCKVMHFSFWHPFAYLSCSKSLLFVVAFCCETPMFWLCCCLLCVCCVCVRMLLYVLYVCVCREMLRIRTVACTLFVCFVFWGWRCCCFFWEPGQTFDY